jgi:outer membrane protein, multidrug efflux system
MKMNNKLLKFALILLLLACSQKKEIAANKELEIPIGYPEFSAVDSNIVEVSWSNFFQDATLKGFIQEAIENNLDLASSRQEIVNLHANLRFAKGLSKPFVEGRISSGVTRYGFYTESGAGNYDANFSSFLSEDQFMARDLRDYFSGFHATWEIDIWGKLKSKKRAALRRYLASQEGYLWAETQIVSTVAIAYIGWLAQIQELKLLDSTAEIQQQALEFASQRKEAGLNTELAVNQLEAQMLNYNGIRLAKIQEIQESENALHFLLGRFPSSSSPTETTLEQSILTKQHLPNPQVLFERRPDVRQAALELSASGADLHAAQMALYPTLRIDAMLGLQSFNVNTFIDPQSMSYQLFGGLVGPVINRSAYKAQIEFSKSKQQQAFYHYQKAMLNAYFETLTQAQRIDNIRKVINLKNKEVEIAARAANNAMLLFQSGKVSFVEVFIAQKEMLNAKLELIEIKRQLLEAEIYFYQAIGGG